MMLLMPPMFVFMPSVLTLASKLLESGGNTECLNSQKHPQNVCKHVILT